MVKNFDRDGSIGRPIWVSDVSRRYSTARMDALLPLQHSVPIEQLEFAPFCYFQSGTPEAFLQSMRSQTGLDTHLLHRGRQLVLSTELLNVVKADFSYLRAKNRGAHGPIQDGDGRCTEYSLIKIDIIMHIRQKIRYYRIYKWILRLFIKSTRGIINYLLDC